MLKELVVWGKKKLASSVTADEVIEVFKKERVRNVILEPACYWRPSIRHLFRHKCVIDYIGWRETRKPIRRQEVLLSMKGRITNERIKKELAELSPTIFERRDEILEKVPHVHCGIVNEYLKMLGGNLYVLPSKKGRARINA